MSLMAFAELCELAQGEHSLPDLARCARDWLLRVTDADEVALLWDVRAASAKGIAAEMLCGGPAEFAAGATDAVVIRDSHLETRFETRQLAARGVCCGLLVSVRIEAERCGALGQFWREPRELGDADVAFIRSVAAVLGIAVTSVLRTAEETYRRETQLADAEAIAHLGSWDLDLKSGDFRWSDEMYRIAGIAPQSRTATLDLASQLVSTSVRELRSIVEGLAPGESTDREYDVKALDGSTRHIRARARRVPDPARSHIIIGAAQDVTEETSALRKQEELTDRLARAAYQWRMTFDSIPAPILLLDAEARVHRLNAAALRLSQFDEYLPALGHHIDKLGPAAVWSELRRIVDLTVRRNESLTLRTRDTAGRHWDVVTSPWQLNDTSHVTLFATDVTSQVRMQESLQRSERMSALGALVSGVAHEVRNPLFAISATLDAIQATRSPDVPVRFTSALRDQVNRMNELLQELLDYGRPQPAELRLGDLGPVIAAARTSVRTLAEKAGVAIVIHNPVDLPPIRMDRGRLLQVFENLLRNAIQHSTAASTVEVRASRRDAGIVVTVADRGPGFMPEDLSRIFQPFFTRRRGGTGLGLSLAQRIVEDHEGTIEAGNRPDGGAIMTVRLPLEHQEAVP